MTIIDNPTLALIARFVVHDINHLHLSDEEFLRRQLAEIEDHIKDVPSDRRQEVVLAWIRDHAESYRQQWQQDAFSRLLRKERCEDCPLIDNGNSGHCLIHERWVSLLEDNLSGKINSEKYIEETLRLLREHKDDLKISARAVGM